MSNATTVVLVTAGCLIGFALALVLSTVLESAVSTIFVCFAEDPQALAEVHPELSQELIAAWEVAHGPLGFAVPSERPCKQGSMEDCKSHVDEYDDSL
jgi:hypothetical protein